MGLKGGEITNPFGKFGYIPKGQTMIEEKIKDIAWYVVRTRAQHENVVRDQITSQSIEVFLPLVDRMRQWKDRKKLVTFPLFPVKIYKAAIRSEATTLRLTKYAVFGAKEGSNKSGRKTAHLE